MKREKAQPWVGVLLAVLLSLTLCPAALADTDGTEPQITRQPDQLVLQLGARWAGVEFELRTDAGIFPAPVVVDSSGVLRMDLGGSTTYTLSCVESTVPIPDPAPPATGQEQTPEDSPSSTTKQPSTSPTPTATQQGIPTTHLLLFLAAVVVGIGCLVAFFIARRRRQTEETEWDEDEDEL